MQAMTAGVTPAVGGNEGIAANHCGFSAAITPGECCADAITILLKSGEFVGGVDFVRSNPLFRRLVQNTLKLAAVDRELRIIEAGVEATQVAPESPGRGGSGR